MRGAVLLALLASACAASHPAPISYGPAARRAAHSAPPPSAPALRPPSATVAPGAFDPLHPPRTHRVAAGESLADIAALYHIPMLALIEQNHLEAPYHLAPDREIELPPPNIHRVEAGENFESIAARFNIQPHSLAILNGMSPPYVVREGDAIVLPAVAAPWPAAATPAPRTPPPRVEPSPPAAHAAMFVWPVHGEVLARFGAQADGRRLDGVEIAAPQGAPVVAAAEGDVVYAGSDLPSYGALILIRHADGYVTAYGYAQSARVREGQHVRAGEAIAEVGRMGDGPTKLMFQVRQGRGAVDPLPLMRN